MDISTGGIVSPADYRDLHLVNIASASVLPNEYFVKEVDSVPVWHQRKIGACVGHAMVKYKQVLDYIETGKINNLSARFVYAMCKCRDGVTGEGTFPRMAASVLKNDGCSTEEDCVNDTTLQHEDYVYSRVETSVPVSPTAKENCIKGYAFVDVSSEQELKKAIVECSGAALLMRVGMEWWTPSWKTVDIIPLKAPVTVVSGHEVYLYGYETEGTRTKFYILNSWSADWGISGKAWFYFDEYKNFLDEAITFTDLPNNWQEQTNNPSPGSFKHNFVKNVKFGQTDPEVKNLQIALKIRGYFPKTQQLTNYFGDITRDALTKFIIEEKLTTPDELVSWKKSPQLGPRARMKLNYYFNK